MFTWNIKSAVLMPETSIIIPSRNEQFMPRTVADILAKAAGDIEIIVVLDGYWSAEPIPNDPRVIVLHRSQPMGMRAAINGAAAIAKGKYLMKTDGHCMFAPGFDQVLKADCEDNWLAIPRRYSLDAELWECKPKAPIDYHYLDCPFTNKDGFQFHGVPWAEKGRERADVLIDDLMSWQGSMWFMHAEHFHKRLHGMSEIGYGTFSQEPQEIGNKTWLGGGRIVVNKNTWYAHLHKGKQYGRGYHIGRTEIAEGHEYSARYWMHQNIEWLIEKFWPVPTWPDNWRDLIEQFRNTA